MVKGQAMPRLRKTVEQKRLNVKIEGELLDEFRAACELKGTSMSDAVIEITQRYVKLYGKPDFGPKARKNKSSDLDDVPSL